MYKKILRKWKKVLEYKKNGAFLPKIYEASKELIVYRASAALLHLRGKVQEYNEKERS